MMRVVVEGTKWVHPEALFAFSLEHCISTSHGKPVEKTASFSKAIGWVLPPPFDGL